MTTTIEKNFITSFTYGPELKGKVAVHAPKGIHNDEIQTVVEHIFDNENNKIPLLDDQSLHTISLKHKTGTVLHYAFDGRTGEIDTASQSAQPLTKLSALSQEIAAPVIRAQAKEHKKITLFTFLKQVWDLIIAALCALFGKSGNIDLHSLNAFHSIASSPQRKQVEEFVGVFKQSIQATENPVFSDIIKQLQHTESISAEMGKALNSATKLAKFSQKTAESIVTSYVQHKADAGRINLCTIDIGYYRNEVYVPVFATFFVENSSIKLRLVNMDPKLEQLQEDSVFHKIHPIQEFAFQSEDENLLKNQIANLMEIFPLFQVKGRHIKEVVVKKAGVHAIQLINTIMRRDAISPEQKKKKEKESAFEALDVIEVMQKVILSQDARATPLPDFLQTLNHRKTGDWWKLLFVTLQAFSAETKVDAEQQMQWELIFLKSYLERLLSSRKHISHAEKIKHMQAIEQSLEKLKTHCEGIYGDPVAFEKIWGSDPLVKSIVQSVERFKTIVLEDERRALKASPADWSVSGKLSQDINRVRASASKSIPKPGLLTEKHIEFQAITDNVQKFTLAATKSEKETLRKTIFQNIDSVIAHIEKDFNNKRYQNVYRGASVLLDSLPPPPMHSNDPLGGDLWDGLSAQELDLVSKKLTQLVHRFWEASLRLQKLDITSFEAFALMNVRAVQIYLLREMAARIRHTGAHSKDERVYALFNQFTCDTDQFFHVFNQHPFHRTGFNPLQEQKRLALLHFFTEGKGHGHPVTLDTLRGRRNAYGFLDNNNFEYEVTRATGCRINKVFESALERDARGDNDPLPPMLIDFRRLTIFSHFLLHPESSLHQSFNRKGVLGDLERQNWLLGTFAKVASEDGSDEAAIRALVREAMKERNQTLKGMPSPLKLKIHHTSAEEMDEPCVVVYQGFPFESRLEFQPTGVLFYDNRDPFHDQKTAGQADKLPQPFLTTITGDTDERRVQERFLNRERPRQQQIKYSLTEVTSWLLEAYDPTNPQLDIELNAKLRGLELNDLDNPKTISVNSLFNVFDIIFNRPDILSQESILRLLELTLYRPGLLLKFCLSHPSYLKENRIGEKLQEALQLAITRDQKLKFSFLLQLNDVLQKDVALAVHLLQSNSPLVKLLLPASVSEKPQYTRFIQEEIEAMLPSFPTMQTVLLMDPKKNDSQMSIEAIVRAWANKADVPVNIRKHLYTTLLALSMRKGSIDSFTNQDWAHLIQAYYFTKYSGEDAGYPVLQAEIGRWFELQALPYLIHTVLTQPQRKDEVLTYHWYLTEKGEATLTPEIPKWKKVNDYVYSLQGANLVTSLATGVITIKGAARGFETLVPDEVMEHPDYHALFGSSPQTARVTPVNAAGSILEFKFVKGGKTFFILQNLQDHTVSIQQEFKFEGKKQRFIYQRFEAKPTHTGQGASKLIQRFGLWQSLKNPSRALCMPNTDPLKWETKNTIQVKLSLSRYDARITAAWDWQGKSIIEDPKRVLSKAFRFADGSDLILKQANDCNGKIDEITFISKDLTLTKVKNQWVSSGQYSDYALSQELQEVSTLFGKEASSFMLPLEKDDPVTKVKEKKYLMWPVRFTDLDKADTETASDQKAPILHVTQMEGTLFKRDNQLQGSSASFLYLAYVSLVHKKYAQGLHYLEKAVQSPFTPHEKEIFHKISTYLIEHADLSKKGIAFRMKSEIAIQKIQRVQLSTKAFQAHQWKLHLDKVKQRMALLDSYKKKVLGVERTTPSSKPLGKDFLLSDEEIVFFERAVVETIEFLVAKAPKENPEASFIKEIGNPVSALKQEDYRQFLKLWLYQLKKTGKTKAIDAIKSAFVSKQEFISIYESLWDQIYKEQLQPGHWKIERLRSLVFHGCTMEEQKLLEAGRNILLTCAPLAALPQELYDSARDMQKAGRTRPGIVKLFLEHLGRTIGNWLANAVEGLKNSCPRCIYHGLRAIVEKIRYTGNSLAVDEEQVIEAIEAQIRAHVPIPQADDENVQEEEKEAFLEYATTIDTIIEELANPNSHFSSEEKVIWDIGLHLLRDEVKTNQERIDLIKVIAGGFKYKMHILGIRHRAETLKQIDSLENALPPQMAPQMLTEAILDLEHPTLKNAEPWLKNIVGQAFADRRWKPHPKILAKFRNEFALHSAQRKGFFKRYEAIKTQPLEAKKFILDLQKKPNQASPRNWYLYAAALSSIEKVPLPSSTDQNWDHFFNALDDALHQTALLQQKNHYLKCAQDVCEIFTVNGTAEMKEMVETENQLRKQGVSEAVQERIAALESSPGVLRSSTLLGLQNAVSKQITYGQNIAKQLYHKIVNTLKQHGHAIPKIAEMQKQPALYSDHDLFEHALHLYEFDQLTPLHPAAAQQPIFNSLQADVTLFLIQATQVQQFQQANRELVKMQKLPNTKDKNIRIQWATLSTQVFNFLKAACSTKRYIDEDGALKNPRFTRKYLVAEYRLGLVYRPEQTATTELITSYPNRAVLRQPGFGKSKAVILPEIAVLAEQGAFPVVLETEELCGIAEYDLDKTNRLIFSQARHIFRFHSSQSIDPIELTDEYHRLLQAKNDKGYIVTTVEALAALDNTLIRISQSLKKSYEALAVSGQGRPLAELQNDRNLIPQLMDLLNTYKQRHWLMKIREIIHSGHFIADEVDDIFDINRWINEAVGEHRPPSRKIIRGIEQVFKTIIATAAQEGDLSILGKALLYNQQANFTAAERKHYLEHMIRSIYRQATPFGLSAEEWGAIKAEMTEDAFVAFVLAKPDNDATFKEENEGEQITAYDYIDTLKQLASDSGTLATVFSEEAGLHYNMNEDGCTIEPRKNGEVLKDTRHGNEYELVAYHFAYYATSAPSEAFFAAQWQKIQTQVTQGTAALEWMDWYKEAHVSHLPPLEQIKTLYQRLQEPESWPQRFRLLIDAAFEQVRLFPHQIRCNVQDPLDKEGITLGGVSGTVNFYALPDSFEKDPSVDSRAVSGELDLDLALMHQNGLNEQLHIFEGQGKMAGKQEILAALQDLNCQAIINLGGALEGMNSLAVVRFLRQALAQKMLKRQICFVDPKTRQQMMWNPGEATPKPFDKSKLKPHALTYFGPPDNRGTDFPIPSGYAIYFTGKTMNEDQRQQSIKRLRQFGKGQTLKVYMHASIRSSLNTKLARAAEHPVTLGEWINDIKLRSVEKTAQSNLKSTMRKTRAPILSEIKKAWFTPWIKDENAYWKLDMDSKEDVARILTDIAADVALDDLFSPYFVHSREPNFRKNMKPVMYVETVGEVTKSFDNAKDEAMQLRNQATAITNGHQIFNTLNKLIPDVEKMPIGEDLIADYLSRSLKLSDQKLAARLEKFHAKENLLLLAEDLDENQANQLLHMIFGQASQEDIPPHQLLNELFQKATYQDIAQFLKKHPELIEHINSIMAELPQEILERLLDDAGMLPSPILPATQKRMNALQNTLNNIEAKIDKAKHAFIQAEQTDHWHSRNLKKSMPAAEDMDAHAQEQVQQQQQQQTQNQQLEQNKKRQKPEEINPNYAWNNWLNAYPGTSTEKSLAAIEDFSKRIITRFVSLQEAARTLLANPAASFGFSNSVSVSINQLALLKARKHLSGNTMDKIAVVSSSNHWHMAAIDALDHAYGFTPAIQALNAQQNPHLHVEIHSLHSDLNETTLSSTEVLESVGTSIHANSPRFFQELVQIKIVLGCLVFSAEETEALHLWLSARTPEEKNALEKLICKIHDVDRLSQLPTWNSSPLSAYLR